MGRPCNICAHSDRGQIDAALMAGVESLRIIADRFGVSKLSVFRHSRNHLAPEAVQSLSVDAEATEAGGDDASPTPPAQADLVAIAKLEEIAEERVPPVDAMPRRRAVAGVEAGDAAACQTEYPPAFTRTLVPVPMFRVTTPTAAVKREEETVMPIDGKAPGPCARCGGRLWRLRADGSLICPSCHPMPSRA
jgi:hypothetical protein